MEKPIIGVTPLWDEEKNSYWMLPGYLEGVKEAAQLSYAGAHYLCEKLIATGHFSLAYDQPFFNEFCVKYNIINI